MPDDGYSSNIEDISRLEEELLRGWNLGDDADAIAGAVAEGLRERTYDRGLGADGERLKVNEPKYAARKAKEFGSTRPLVRTGQLLDIESLKGDVEASPDAVTMTYGTGGAGEGGGPTDREKAAWNSGERPFYALDDAIVDERVMPIVADALDRRLEGR